MLLVDTYIGVSEENIVGLFSKNEIKRGTPIWKFHENTTQIFWRKQFLSACVNLPLPALIDFIENSYIKGGNVYFLNDNTKCINHSLTPNIAFQTENTLIAVTDILSGEEITQNYFKSYDAGDFIFIEDLFKDSTHTAIYAKLEHHFSKIGRARSNFLVK